MLIQRKKSCVRISVCNLFYGLYLLLFAFMPVHYARADGFLQPEEGYSVVPQEPETVPDASHYEQNAPDEKVISDDIIAEDITKNENDDSEEDDYIPDDEELIFSYDLQGYDADDYFYAYNLNKTVYLPMSQIASAIGIDYILDDKVIVANFTNNTERKYVIDLNNMTANNGDNSIDVSERDYKNIEDTVFFSVDFLQRFFDIEVKIDFYNMEMSLDSEMEFPSNVKRNAEKKRNIRAVKLPSGSFEDYEMDNRLFGSPVLDINLGKNWRHSKNPNRYSNSDSYTVNFSGIVGGLDINSFFSGSSSDNNRKPTVRLTGSRVFLDEPPNVFNLKSLKVGDISGMNESYFASSGSGRGIFVSSFKDLVMSADKTIDITGPLKEGWEVELYWNDMLIGYRQNGVDGEYSFPNTPVNYGLNKFKLVFYGPYGEVVTEEKRYYSGTSPVKKGEVGYTSSVFQANRHLFENNEKTSGEKNNAPVVNTNVYYGYNDDLTLMAGYTKTTEADNIKNNQQFGMAGLQYNLTGSSIQYNLGRNLDTDRVSHHFDWQGNIYLGYLYASYDKYNKIHSPVSYYGGEYLKDKTEFRFSGSTHNTPYSITYKTGEKEVGGTEYQDISFRVSKQITLRTFLSLEDEYSMKTYTNRVIPTLYYHRDKYSLQTSVEYSNKPHSEFKNFSSQLTWRDDKYTYYTLSYKRDLVEDMDYLTLTGARIFPFGGLSASASIDKKANLSLSLNYSNSFAKEPDKNDFLTSAKSKFSKSGTIYISAHDENGNPVKGAGIIANNMVNKIYTNEEGAAMLADLRTYEKTLISIDIDNIEDLTLKPLFYEKKIVLRPGTMRHIILPFIHVGIIEGQIENPKGRRMYGYKISAIDKNGDEKASVFSDLEGYFIMEDVPYGEYDLTISKEGKMLTTVKDIVVDDFDILVDGEIKLSNEENKEDENDNSEDEQAEETDNDDASDKEDTNNNINSEQEISDEELLDRL